MAVPFPVRATALLLLAVCAAAPLPAQCPDGTPPPCPKPGPLQSPPDPHGVAVLYFRNLTGDTADAYLADGLTEAIIARLGQIQRLSVKSSAAVMRFRGRLDTDPAALGRSLHVANLLSGALRRSGARFRITVELTRAATGTVQWSEQYTRAGDDLLGIEEEVSRAVAQGVVGRLLPQERASLAAPLTRSATAYEHFLRGNANLARRNPVATGAAVREFEAAARFDTTFAEAYARQAVAYELLLDWGWPYGDLSAESLLVRGFAAADRALAMKPVSADAWMARGLLLAQRSPRAREGVVPALERAVSLDPRNAEAWHQLGVVYWHLGRDSASIEASRRVLAIEPGRAITLIQLVLTCYAAGRVSEARKWLDSTIAADPTFVYGYVFRALDRVRERDLTGAREDARNAAQLSGANPLPAEAAFVAVEALAGDTLAARARLDALTGMLARSVRTTFREALFAATAALAVGDHARALEIVERVQPRGGELWSGLRLPVFDPIRSEPRFQRLIEEARPPGN